MARSRAPPPALRRDADDGWRRWCPGAMPAAASACFGAAPPMPAGGAPPPWRRSVAVWRAGAAAAQGNEEGGTHAAASGFGGEEEAPAGRRRCQVGRPHARRAVRERHGDVADHRHNHFGGGDANRNASAAGTLADALAALAPQLELAAGAPPGRPPPGGRCAAQSNRLGVVVARLRGGAGGRGVEEGPLELKVLRLVECSRQMYPGGGHRRRVGCVGQGAEARRRGGVGPLRMAWREALARAPRAPALAAPRRRRRFGCRSPPTLARGRGSRRRRRPRPRPRRRLTSARSPTARRGAGARRRLRGGRVFTDGRRLNRQGARQRGACRAPAAGRPVRCGDAPRLLQRAGRARGAMTRGAAIARDGGGGRRRRHAAEILLWMRAASAGACSRLRPARRTPPPASRRRRPTMLDALGKFVEPHPMAVTVAFESFLSKLVASWRPHDVSRLSVNFLIAFGPSSRAASTSTTDRRS